MEPNSRDIFLKIINFEKSPRTIRWEFGYWGGTIRRWYSEGLRENFGIPADRTYGDVIAGPGLQWPESSFDEGLYLEKDVASLFEFDKGFTYLPVNQWFSPRFERKVIEETEDTMVLTDSDGIKKKIFKDNRCMPFWLDFPIKDEKDWDRLVEERLNLNDLKSRMLNGFADAVKSAKSRDYPLSILGDPCGFFGCLRYLLGEVRLFMMYYDNPNLIKKMNSYLCDFWISFAEELLGYTDFDFGYFFEDMSGKQGMLISPDIFNEFMSPYYKKIISFLKSKGIKNIIVDSDGFVEKLIPLLKSTGVTGMLPFEKQAGNDLLKIRKENPEFVIMGGFNKAILRDGNKNMESDLDKELNQIRELIKTGGFIPFGDHFIPPDVSWKNFSNYRLKLNNIIENTKVLI
ncbi:MAG: uroporphyrinogen decarboxylase family protein [Candidatus Humimicrobiaceae bacterium]